jgi:cell division protein FtsI (penicillin-binding protein 3)
LGDPARRLGIAAGLLGMVVALLVGRLIQVQGLQGETYAAVAQSERLRTIDIPATRGMISDRDGEVLARSVESRTVTADPHLIADPLSYAHLLAGQLGVDEATLATRMADRTKRYVVLARGVDPMVWRQLQTTVDPGTGKPISGVFAEVSSKRIYPADTLAANVLGFVNSTGIGSGGIEHEFDDILAGVPGKQTYERDSRGGRIATAGGRITEPVPGNDIQLTIDRDIQWVAQKAIASQVRRTKADSGTVVVQNVRTGEILAMATAPTFDPNNPGASPAEDRGNRAVSQVYEPGSIGKAMTMAALLDSGAATPDTKIRIPGTLPRAGHVLHDDVQHGLWRLTLSGVLAKSSNIGTVLATDTMGISTLYKYMKAFGIGEQSGLGFPGESRGLFTDVNDWSGTQKYTVPFGQGYAVNTVQAASIYQTIANGGVRIAPRLIKSWTGSDGLKHVPAASETTQVVSPQTAALVAKMLETVVHSGGTAPDVKVPGYRVAGKTGTAQFADPKCGCYRGYTASFAGFAPADNPEIVVSVTLQRPSKGHFGGELGGPVFMRTITFALQALGIRPTGVPWAPMTLDW